MEFEVVPADPETIAQTPQDEVVFFDSLDAEDISPARPQQEKQGIEGDLEDFFQQSPMVPCPFLSNQSISTTFVRF